MTFLGDGGSKMKTLNMHPCR